MFEFGIVKSGEWSWNEGTGVGTPLGETKESGTVTGGTRDLHERDQVESEQELKKIELEDQAKLEQQQQQQEQTSIKTKYTMCK
ncbi:unnamed protein product [Ambrosiozyma monospora]|uniref:Unnamed protein product n=1 Tax=Ambrosiozyma monospora TaxID=43982 RepID=A0A9W7DI42_AMBMO|nr:unnamed protein product [Ambrosiozyma monospora]